MKRGIRDGLLVSTLAWLLLFGGAAHACALSYWDDVQDINSILSASESARFEGQCGLRVALDGTYTGYVEDTTPGTVDPIVTEYSVRFYIHVGEFTLGTNDAIALLSAHDLASDLVFSMSIYQRNGSLYTRLLAVDDSGAQIDTLNNGMLLKPGWRSIEVRWVGASSGLVPDGELIISVDGVTGTGADVLTGFDNDSQSIYSVRLGVLSGNSGSISGVMDLDSFDSGRGISFGPIAKPCVAVDVDLRDVTFLPGDAVCETEGSIRLGPRATIDDGAEVQLHAPRVSLSGISVASGAILQISQSAPP